ncbi:nucleotide disphospho-sugar-binding domain-containing protein [Thalassoglobus sp. JC818]|uniref:glycosyltransferase n=1 Tax=Thalassoglobus sp. JC818 TaxID=3232136 RepID=UPI0034584395
MTQSKKILLGWDLGAGIGYTLQLRDIANSLAKSGHSPTLALRSIETAHQYLRDCDFPVLQAPYLIGRLTRSAQRDGFFPTSFTDLMACNGFGSEDHLYSMLRGWRDLIDLVKPDLIVGRYCPLLTLAAYGRIPVVLFGAGYSTPPVHEDDFPVLWPEIEPYANSSDVLGVIERVQRRFSSAVPQKLTDAYRGERRVIATLPQLDPYRSCRIEPCFGPFDPAPPPVLAHKKNFYAYFSGAGELPFKVGDALMQSDLQGTVYIRDSNGFEFNGQNPRIQSLTSAPKLSEIVRDSAVVIHHGGLGTTQAALLAGRPQILLPQVTDQFLSANGLKDECFVAQLSGVENAATIANVAEVLMTDKEVQSAAMETAISLRGEGLHNSKERVLSACLELLC